MRENLRCGFNQWDDALSESSSAHSRKRSDHFQGDSDRLNYQKGKCRVQPECKKLRHLTPFAPASTSFAYAPARTTALRLIVLGHFAEHLVQVYQIYVLHWHPRLAGGILGLYYPKLAQNEVLHIAYNSAQLTGLILLWAGFQRSSKAARCWWNVALVAQSWHFFEHVLLQVQYITGNFLFDASRQTSLLELFFPRVELHLTYNLLAIIPTAIAVIFYLRWYFGNRDA